MSRNRLNEDLPRLLRVIARGTQAQENKHDIVFNAAADEIERLRAQCERLRGSLERAGEGDGIL
jgi:HAMP domain-containing protein